MCTYVCMYVQTLTEGSWFCGGIGTATLSTVGEILIEHDKNQIKNLF